MHRNMFHASDLAIRPYIVKFEVWGDLGNVAVFLYLYINSRSTTEWPVCYRCREHAPTQDWVTCGCLRSRFSASWVAWTSTRTLGGALKDLFLT